nr:hypothetical protein [Tanacetum cinerariifolium]GFB73570.1 hypothetical protein [Tanacetum cinerariifolium]
MYYMWRHSEGGLCVPCDLREKNLYNCDPNAYSYNNSNYFSQPQDENYLCNLCENNSHDDYDYQQQFPFIYEQEPSYNQNYDDNYYPHESLSFPCCDYCEGSHETFQCQTDIQNDEEYNIQYKGYLEKSPDAVTTVLSHEKPEYSLSMGYKHPNTTLETKSDEIIKSGVEELVPIPRECEVTSEDKRECDVLVYEDSSTFDVCDDHSEILSDSNNDDISSDADALKDIEYVEALLPDLELVSLEEENDVYQEDAELLAIIRKRREVVALLTHAHNSLPEYDSFCFKIEPDQEMLTSVVKNDISDNSTNDPLLEEFNLFLASDNSIPSGIENFGYDLEGDICFLEELLIIDSIPFPNNE